MLKEETHILRILDIFQVKIHAQSCSKNPDTSLNWNWGRGFKSKLRIWSNQTNFCLSFLYKEQKISVTFGKIPLRNDQILMFVSLKFWESHVSTRVRHPLHCTVLNVLNTLLLFVKKMLFKIQILTFEFGAMPWTWTLDLDLNLKRCSDFLGDLENEL